MTSPNDVIARNLARFREDAGLSQPDLSELTGLTPKTIQRYESGESSPTAEALAEFATILARDPGDFFKEDPPPPPRPEELPALFLKVRPGVKVSEKDVAEVREAIRLANERIRAKKMK